MTKTWMDYHEHFWGFVEDASECEECHYSATIAVVKCRCGKQIGPSALEQILNDPTVKTIINVVIARRNDEVRDKS